MPHSGKVKLYTCLFNLSRKYDTNYRNFLSTHSTYLTQQEVHFNRNQKLKATKTISFKPSNSSNSNNNYKPNGNEIEYGTKAEAFENLRFTAIAGVTKTSSADSNESFYTSVDIHKNSIGTGRIIKSYMIVEFLGSINLCSNMVTVVEFHIVVGEIQKTFIS